MRRRLFILAGKAVNIGDKLAQTGSNVDITGHHLEVALLQLIKQETEYYCQRMIYSKLAHFFGTERTRAYCEGGYERTADINTVRRLASMNINACYRIMTAAMRRILLQSFQM